MENNFSLHFSDASPCKTPNRTPLKEISNQINNWCIPKLYPGQDEFMGVIKSPNVELTPDRAECSLLASKSPSLDDALIDIDRSNEAEITPNSSAFIQSFGPKLEDSIDTWICNQILASPKSEVNLDVLDMKVDQGQEVTDSVKDLLRFPSSWHQNRDGQKSNMARKLAFEGKRKNQGDQCGYAEKEEIVQTTAGQDRDLLRLVDEDVPSIGLTEEVKTQFEVVEIMVMHSKKGKRMVLGAEEGFQGASSSKGRIIASPESEQHSLDNIITEAPQPFRVIKCENKDNPGSVPGQVCLTSNNPAEDFDSICHFMRYEIVDGRKTKVYECGICRRTFKHQYTLMRHLPTHTDERNYACQTCGKAFRQMSTLIQHGAIHSNVRPYVCDVCHNTFNRVSTLISHKKTHSGNKPHLCTYCGKRFHQKGNLRNHIFTHTNERPYKCEICGKGFNQKSNLICHRSRYHAAPEDFSCEICSVKFPKKRGLVSHMFYKHNVEMETNTRKRKPSERTCVRSKENRKGSNAAVPNAALKKQFHPSAFGAETPSTIENGSGDNNCNLSSMCLPKQMDTSLHMVIDPINSEAMTQAQSLGQIPFVLFKSARGTEQLMRAMSAPQFNKQMLVPVTVDDLKSTQNGLGKVVAPNTTYEFQVSTVATIQQQINENGTVEMIEIPYPSSCQIKIEPVFQNMALTHISGWPGPAVTTAFVNPEVAANNMETFAGLNPWRNTDSACFQGQSLFPVGVGVGVGNGEGASLHLLEQAGLMSPQLLELNSPTIDYEDYKPYVNANSGVRLGSNVEVLTDDVDFSALLA